MWALLTALNALTTAFSIYAVVKSAALTAPAGGVGAVATGASIAAGTSVALASISGPLSAYQRGVEYVPEDTIAVLHRGERVVRSDQPTPGGGGGTLIVDMRGAYILDPHKFVQIIKKELSKEWSVSTLR